MRILISGASGLIGGNCLQHFVEQGHETTGTHLSHPTPGTVYFNTLTPCDNNEFDIRRFAPDIILHCGALTNVDYCEKHVSDSHEMTVTSTRNLLRFAHETRAIFVYISTDYIFDGRDGPYSEEARPNPLNVYGRHKLDAERLILSTTSRHLIIRVTNVYGREVRNKNFVSRIIEQAKSGQPVTLKLPCDQYATPVNAWDVARAIRLLLNDNHFGIFHVAGADWVSRQDVATSILKYFPDASHQIEAVSTRALGQPADRPLKGGLLANKFTSIFRDFHFGTIDTFVQSVILRPQITA